MMLLRSSSLFVLLLATSVTGRLDSRTQRDTKQPDQDSRQENFENGKPHEALAKIQLQASRNAIESSEGFAVDIDKFKSGFCKKKCGFGQRCVIDNGIAKCVSPCSTVCNFECHDLQCDVIGAATPAYPLSWWIMENTPCWQIENHQFFPMSTFVRTKCACPKRNYSVSEPCPGGNAAHLSNCIQAWLSQEPEINFGNLHNVLLGYVRATGFEADVDYQGTVTNSRVCRTTGHDIEFGGGICPAHIEGNRFDHFEMADDLQFEEGTTIVGNSFGTVNIGDKLKVADDSGTFATTITDNYFDHIHVTDECEDETGSATITNNECITSSGTLDNCNNSPFAAPGFSCF